MRKSRFFCVLVFFAAACVMFSASAAGETGNLPFATYNYTRAGDMTYSPAVYTVENLIKLAEIENASIGYLTDFSTDSSGNLLIADNENGRVFCLDSNWRKLWQITELTLNGTPHSLIAPYCAIQAPDGFYYISDTGPADKAGIPQGDGRIYKLDKERNLVKIFEKPVIPQLADDGISYSYIPQRFSVDETGRLYIIAKGVNEGFIQLDKNGVFQGFIGAPAVTNDPWQILLRRFSTKAQRARMQLFVPTEYSGVDIKDGFLYVTTQTYNQRDINNIISIQINRGALNNSSSVTEMIRKMNPAGNDILRRRGAFSPVGDILLPNLSINGAPRLSAKLLQNQEVVLGSSKFVDIKSLDGGMYAALDRVRSRVFLYDNDGNLICAFGSGGERSSSFSDPIAIEVSGEKLYVLNAGQGTVTVCGLTDYGREITQACKMQYSAEDVSPEIWESILSQNANYEPAYDAMGRYYLDRDDASAALKCFKLSNNRADYSEAFKIVRNDFASRYFIFVILGVLLLIAGISALKRLLSALGQRETRAGRIIAKSNYCFYTLIHPFDGAYCLKHEGRGAVGIAAAQLTLLGVSSVLKLNASGFIFNQTDIRYENVIFTFFTVLLPYMFFVVSNWCLNTLFDGKGTIKDILIFTGCSTLPLTAANIIYWLLSFTLSADEGAVQTIILLIGTVWMVLLFISATISVHDYTLTKSLVSLLCSILGIVIIVFIIMFFYDIIFRIIRFAQMIYFDLSIR